MRTKVLAIVTLSLSIAVSYAADIGNQFVRVRLAHGASVEVPRSWRVMRGTEMMAMETAVGALIDLSGYKKDFQGYDALLSANFPDPEFFAAVSITSVPVASVTPSFALSITDADLRSSEISGRQGIETIQARLGNRVLGWTPMRKMQIGPNVVTHTSYVRTSQSGDTRVHMYKFFGTSRVFDVVVSTRVAQESLNQPTLNRIVQSFIVGSE